MGEEFVAIFAFLVSLLPAQVSPTVGEDQFVKQYGNHAVASGRWPYAESLKENPRKLVSFCRRAHKAYKDVRVNISEAYVSAWLVNFDDKSYIAIRADIVMYAIGDKKAGPDEYVKFEYMMKGLRDDCVFYLEETKPCGTEFYVGTHVCRIKMDPDMRGVGAPYTGVKAPDAQADMDSDKHPLSPDDDAELGEDDV